MLISASGNPVMMHYRVVCRGSSLRIKFAVPFKKGMLSVGNFNDDYRYIAINVQD